MSQSIHHIFDMSAVPFTREFAVDQAYQHPQYDEVVNDTLDAISDRMSAVITAVPGAGKTVVARRIVNNLPPAGYRVHEVKVNHLSKRDFCRELAMAMGAKPAGHTGALVRALQDRCRHSMDTESIRPVIIIDEAQDIRPDVLSLLKLITNFDMDSRLVVSFVLIGHPSLLKQLKHPQLEDIARRIARYSELRNLDREDTNEYMKHRLRMVRAKDNLFDRRATEAIFECTGGNLRAIDRLALESIRQAARGGEPVIGYNHVVAARAKVLL